MPMQSVDPLPEALLDSARLQAALATGEPAAALCRTALEHADAWLDQQFLAGHSIRELIHLRARVVDTLLQHLWERHAWPGDDICLVAVGGYGRSELHPHSDIDLLILLTDEHATLYHRTIEQFVTELWDLHLNIGHSVRTLAECCTDAAADVTIVTSLMESRPLAGHSSLYKHLVHCIRPLESGPARTFSVPSGQSRKPDTTNMAIPATAWNPTSSILPEGSAISRP